MTTPDGGVTFNAMAAFINSVTTGVTGISGSTLTREEMLAALADQSAQIASLSAQVTALTTVSATPDTAGVAQETFEYVNATALDSSLWNNEWLEGTSSDIYLAVPDGHNAQAVCPASPLGAGNTKQVWAQFKGTHASMATDNNDVAIVVAQQQTRPTFSSVTPALSCYGRVNTARTAWVRARFQPDGKIMIHYKNGGAVSSAMVTSTGNGNPAVGAELKLRCGTAANAYLYQAMLNGVVKASWNDTGHLTAVGSTNRQGGWGAMWSDDNAAGKITQWTMADHTA